MWDAFELTDEGEHTGLQARVKMMGGIRQRAVMSVGRRTLRRVMEKDLEKLAGLVEARR